MQLFLKGKRTNINALAEYNVRSGKFTVLKGSHVSHEVSTSTKFRGVKTVLSLRSQYVKDGITTQNVIFQSPSTAANFVTGTSTNGLAVWKNGKGDRLGTILKKP